MYDKKKSLNVLDIGTGSGCLLISILKERKNFLGIGDLFKYLSDKSLPRGVQFIIKAFSFNKFLFKFL